jgi:hypothetical protein
VSFSFVPVVIEGCVSAEGCCGAAEDALSSSLIAMGIGLGGCVLVGFTDLTNDDVDVDTDADACVNADADAAGVSSDVEADADADADADDNAGTCADGGGD